MGLRYRSATRVKGGRSQLRTMAARGQWMLGEMEGMLGLASSGATFLAFLAACCLLPCLLLLSIALNAFRGFWLRCLERRFSGLEFVKKLSVRSTIDTKRNLGVVTVLLQVQGHVDMALVKNRLLEHIVERRDNDGRLAFPHLRTALTARWGRYAWEKDQSFHLENHLVESSNFFRGRPVTAVNIQDFVSDIVSKYLPTGRSPWQLMVVNQPERALLLLRIHHLLLSEDGVALADLLLLQPLAPAVHKHQQHDDEESPPEDEESWTAVDVGPSPLLGLFRRPVALPTLGRRIALATSRSWECFLERHDPIRRPGPRVAGLAECAALFVVTAAAAVRRLQTSAHGWSLGRLFGVASALQDEAALRGCSFSYVVHSAISSMYPWRMAHSAISWAWWTTRTMLVDIPTAAVRALGAGDTRRSHVALLCGAARELGYLWHVAYTAPRTLLEDLVLTLPGSAHQLQTMSLCGRKVVAWSDPAPLDLLRRLHDATGASQTELLLFATAGALREYFRQMGLTAPDVVLTTSRFLPQEVLVSTEDRPPAGGVLCLALPTRTARGDDDPLEALGVVRAAVAAARRRQPALYLASSWLPDGALLTHLVPSIAVQLLLNALSRRYAVTVTEVAPLTAGESRRRLVWGQEVEELVYWRPPQANITVSLTLVSYGPAVRLAVMTDSLLSPHHAAVARGFLQQLNELASAVGVPRDRACK